MGVGNLIRNAILGPLVIWATLLAIALGWHFLQSPPALSIQDFAASTPKEVKEALIKMRQPLIQEVIQLYKGNVPKDFFSNRLTDDFEFEDPTGRYVGQNELAEFYKVILAAVSDLDFDIKGEYHGPHEIVMDWTMRFKLVPLWFPIELPMRAHILLEPAEQGGKLEKIFRIYEEWNGNVLMTEKTVKFPLLGAVQQKLRRFFGYSTVTLASKLL